MHGRFFGFFTASDGIKYRSEISSLTDWIREKNLTGSVIFLKVGDSELFFKVSNLAVLPTGSRESAKFILCESEKFVAARDSVERHLSQSNDWHRIFGSFRFEIWECEDKSSPLPLRFGLLIDERSQALAIVRASAHEAVRQERKENINMQTVRHDGPDAPHFHESATVCVAVWIQGNIRGSKVVHRRTLFEAIVHAARRAMHDRRFKPISPEELEEARLELTIISDLRMSIGPLDLQKKTIHPEQAHFIECDENSAWYVPEVFNTRPFKNLRDLLRQLAKKAKISPERLSSARAYCCDVHDFIENTDYKSVLTLSGPVPIVPHRPERDNFLNLGIRAANQLLRIQEVDGAIPAVVDPHSGRIRKHFGWSQQSCTGWSMVLFGSATHNDAILQAGIKALQYFRKYIYDYPTLSMFNKAASLTYYGRAMAVLGETDEVLKAKEFILSQSIESVPYRPITFSNIASFLGEVSHGNRTVEERALWYAERVSNDFNQRIEKKETLSLAIYPELIHAYHWFLQWEKAPPYVAEARRMIDWYVRQQLSDGAFPANSHSTSMSYSRGTGKIFEVLSLFYQDNKDVLLKAAAWLNHMQYSEESAYFVPPHLRETVHGAFRRDYLNPQMWIDASAHVLIGVSRIINS